MFLLDDILLAPLKATVWLGEKIDEIVKAEEHDENRIKETLLELQMRLDMGSIGEDEYRRQETALLERLDAICTDNEEK